MTVFVKTDDAIYPCDGYFFLRMTHVAPNKWGVFATQLGLPQPTLLTEYQDDEVFSGHDRAEKALDYLFKNIKDEATIDLTKVTL